MQRDINVNVGGPQQAASQYKTIVLKGNQSFKSQIESAQSEITKAHQREEDLAFKFVIKFNFDLGGESVTIPANCVLEFDGGSLSNGTLIGNNTGINAGLIKIFNIDVTLAGTWNVAEAYPEWFGAIGDGVADDRMAVQKVLDYFGRIYITNHYFVDGSLTVPKHKLIHGNRDLYACVLTVNGNVNLNEQVTLRDLNIRSSNNTTELISIANISRAQCDIYLENLSLRGALGVDSAELANAAPKAIVITSSTVGFYKILIRKVITDGFFYSAVDVELSGDGWLTDLCVDDLFAYATKHTLVLNGNGSVRPFTSCIFNNIRSEYNQYASHFIVVGSISKAIFSNLTPFDYWGSTNNIALMYFATDFSSVKLTGINETNDIGKLQDYKGNKGLAVISRYISVMEMEGSSMVWARNTSLDLNVSGYKNSVAYFARDVSFDINNAIRAVVGFMGTTWDYYSPNTVLATFLGFDPMNRMPVVAYRDGNTLKSYSIHNELNPIRYSYANRPSGVSTGFFHFDTTYKKPIWYTGLRWVGADGFSPMPKSGTTAERPIAKHLSDGVLVDGLAYEDVGFCYFDTELGKPIYAKFINTTTGVVTWVDATGVIAGTSTSGTFANKPTVSANNIPIGFKYFCIDKQTTEGDIDGIEIIHTGNDVWVDALGRIVS